MGPEVKSLLVPLRISQSNREGVVCGKGVEPERAREFGAKGVEKVVPLEGAEKFVVFSGSVGRPKPPGSWLVFEEFENELMVVGG